MSRPISGRRDGSNIMVTTGPDVCWTPMGGGMVPVAYSCVVDFEGSRRVSEDVRNNALKDFQLNTRAQHITGHEPGTGKGVVVRGYKQYSHVKTASSSVFSEGHAVVRDGDPAWINHPDIGPTEPRRARKAVTVPSLWHPSADQAPPGNAKLAGLAEDLEAAGGGPPRIQPTPKGAPQFLFPNGMKLRFDIVPGSYGPRGPHINLEPPGGGNIHIPVSP